MNLNLTIGPLIALLAGILIRIDADDDFRDLDRILQSVPGVGIGLSAAVLASFVELGTLHKNKAAALLGVAPFNKDSGQRITVQLNERLS